MVAEILKVAETKLNGLAEIVTSLKVEEVKGSAREKVEIPLIFELPEKANIKEVYLDLSVMGITRKWRLYIGDFSLTKEFKPLITSEVYNNVISKFIFNITPTKHVVLSDPTLRVINNSKEPIRILQASLVLFYEYEGLGRSEYFYGVSLKPYTAISGVTDPNKASYVYSVLFSKYLNDVNMKLGNCAKTFKIDNVGEVNLECDRGGGYAIEGTNPFVPLTIIAGSYELSLPKLELDVKRNGNEIRVKVSNKGSKADSVIMIAYSSGRVLGRYTLGELREGETKEIAINVKVDRNTIGIGIRVIWVKANLRDFVEKFVPL